MRPSDSVKKDSTRQDLYPPLGIGCIRLLGILPHKDPKAPIQCRLFEYPLQELGEGTHLYEALSYVWGDPTDSPYVSVNRQRLAVRANLHAALSSLRDAVFERIIWVDSICMDQENDGENGEKGEQILRMAEIYNKASRVIVWLGKAENDSNQALEEIRLAADDMDAKSSVHKPNRQAILTLLQRPWFKRIWVLQEVAAARNILIKCGATEIDGYIFCIGLDSEWVNLLGEAASDLRRLIRTVTYLMRGAILRRNKVSKSSDRFALLIRPLCELIDMYHTHKASKRHDKIYALLGMSSDDPTSAGIKPIYDLPWRELMQCLVRFVLSRHVAVDIWDERATAVLKSKGCVLGKVSTGDVKSELGGGQMVEAIIQTSPGGRISGSTPWLLHTSATSVEDGDLICLLRGAPKPTIIRLFGDHFRIVLIAAEPPKNIHTFNGNVEWAELAQSASFIRDFVLVWDWETPVKNGHSPDQHNSLIRISDSQSQHAKTQSEHDMDNAVRSWNIAQILGDLEVYSEAAERTRKAAEFFLVVVREKHTHSLQCQCSQVPLLWAAANGDDAVVCMLLTKNEVDPDLEDYCEQTPLSWAARNGHEAVVKLLLETGKADADSQDNHQQTPLSWAARNGHEAAVKLLLETGKADADSQDWCTQTPLSWAARNGHEAVVKLLLEMGKVDADSKDNFQRTPLWWAAINGHEAVVKLLLETGKADAGLKDEHGWTTAQWAAVGDHEAVVKLLQSPITFID